jgi:Gas vesicle synthesis protein GvpO
MAEQQRRRRRRDDGSSGSDGSGRRSRRGRSGAEVAQFARQELGDITGLKAQGVTGLERYDDGTWKVTVELLELSRIPETDDILGCYEVEVDEDGELLGYRRVRRYARHHVLEERGAGGS